MIDALQKLPKLNSIDGRLVLTDLYESHYGIYNHLTSVLGVKRPLASVALHPSEDINEQSLLEQACHSYINRGIKELFGLSLIEFLELPMDVVELLFTISSDHQAEKSKTLSDVEKQFKS